MRERKLTDAMRDRPVKDKTNTEVRVGRIRVSCDCVNREREREEWRGNFRCRAGLHKRKRQPKGQPL